jgi:hypothetical protein
MINSLTLHSGNHTTQWGAISDESDVHCRLLYGESSGRAQCGSGHAQAAVR